MDYNTTDEQPYNLTMAKGEYKSIAILLDPGKNYDETLEFTNTTFSNAGVTLDKYIAPVWYQAGKDNSNSDAAVSNKEFIVYYNTEEGFTEGSAWLTQELLLKNGNLVKIERDPNEKNLIYYAGKNLLYTTRRDGGSESFGSYGSVPGYLQISSLYDTKLDFHTRYNLLPNDDNMLVFDDSLTIQPFRLKDEYKLLWGIIHVDTTASTGEHTANIEIKVGGTTVKTIPIKINVLDYKLSKSILDYGLYYHGRYEGEYPFHSVWAQPNVINKTRDQLKKDLKDMFDHGILYPLVEIPMSRQKSDFLMKDLEDVGFPNDKFFSWDGDLFARPTTDPQKIYDLQMDMENNSYFKNAQLYIGINDEASVSELLDAKRWIRDVARGDEWRDRLRIKTWGSAFSSAVDILADGGYFDVPILSDFGWKTKYQLEHFLEAEEDENGNMTDAATVYKYGDPQSGVENPEVYRRNYGISMYQEGYNGGGMDYVYQKQYGFFWNDFDIDSGNEKNHREEAFTYPTSGLVEGGKGFVGTIQWEGYRDAIMDMRYLTTLLNKRTDGNKEDIDNFIEDLDTSDGSDLDAVRQQIINEINKY
jgi:hypothetical protein